VHVDVQIPCINCIHKLQEHRAKMDMIFSPKSRSSMRMTRSGIEGSFQRLGFQMSIIQTLSLLISRAQKHK
jgi:hypothetical protein